VQAGAVDIAVHQEDFGATPGKGGRKIGGDEGLPFLGRCTGHHQGAVTLSAREREADSQQAKGLGFLGNSARRTEHQLLAVSARRQLAHRTRIGAHLADPGNHSQLDRTEHAVQLIRPA
jgi:hypothetical protein